MFVSSRIAPRDNSVMMTHLVKFRHKGFKHLFLYANERLNKRSKMALLANLLATDDTENATLRLNRSKSQCVVPDRAYTNSAHQTPTDLHDIDFAHKLTLKYLTLIKDWLSFLKACFYSSLWSWPAYLLDSWPFTRSFEKKIVLSVFRRSITSKG